MIPHQTFYCPRCGAPGQVNFGQAEYSCLCRHGYFEPTPKQTERKPCPCKGHPFHCFNHPNDCGCTADQPGVTGK